MSYDKDHEIKNKNTGEDTVHHSRKRKKEAEKGNARKRSHSRTSAKRTTTGRDTTVEGTTATAHHAAHKKKYKMNWKQFAKFACCIILLCCIGVGIYVGRIIAKAPEIKTDNIYSMLIQSSTMYDADGNVMDSVVSAAGQNRTIVEIKDMPEDLQNAFIALEDKTFRTHKGFNIIRIFGAIKEAILHGGGISGTSTITQQLARNVYLPDTKFDRDLSRKITEAYYAIILEKELSKDQILEAYLNTIPLGGTCYGVQSAAQAYFSKDVNELTLPECAALAILPQAPTTYMLVQQVSANEINDETENLIMKDGDVAYVWNNNPSVAARIKTCLALMLEQELITQAEYDKAVEVELKDIVKPNTEALNVMTNYFADYTIKKVISDLQEEYDYDYNEAFEKVYRGGLKIYTTFDPKMQAVIEKEFENDANFPAVIPTIKDKKGNILDEYGNILLYQYSNYISGKGYFRLKSKEYQWNDDGSLTIFAGKRLNLYDTTVQGASDVSVEFKNMYVVDDGVFYTISGGYINIPQNYKSKDEDGNLLVSAAFFKDYPDFFMQDGKQLITKGYTLQQRVIQPQTAMTIIDNETGQVKAMVGGRKVNGRMILNRATANRQPGSSIKPLSVYSAALQRSYELQKAGETFPLQKSKLGKQSDELWGNYLTAASAIDDEPTTYGGKLWPVNSPPGYSGLLTMRVALQKSLNTCAVKILQQVGTAFSFDLLEKYGLTTITREGDVNDDNLAALALGGLTKGVSTLEMASAYTTFVNNGVHKSYNVYTKVTTRTGEILLKGETKETKVLDPGVAWISRNMLQSVVTNGLGTPAAVSGAAAGGKTGTTSDQFDIWFDGFTAKYSASLWIGNDVNIKMSSMSNMAAALWGKIMNQIPNVADGKYSAKPSNVIAVSIDTKSGMVADKGSGSDVRTEYFTTGTQPTKADTLHKTAEICTDSGYLATPSCPHTKKKSGIQRPYDVSSKVADYKRELPHYYCNLHNPDPEEYPVEKGKKVTIVTEKPIDPDDPDDPNQGDDPQNPDDPGTDNPTNPDDPNHPDDPGTDTPTPPPVDSVTPDTGRKNGTKTA